MSGGHCLLWNGNIISSRKNSKSASHSKILGSIVQNQRHVCVVKISNYKISNMPIFFVEKMCKAFALQKLLAFFQQKSSVYFVTMLCNKLVKLTMLWTTGPWYLMVLKWMNLFSGKAIHFPFLASLLKLGQLLKERICSSWSKFFHWRVHPIWQMCPPEKQTGIYFLPLLKSDGKCWGLQEAGGIY